LKKAEIGFGYRRALQIAIEELPWGTKHPRATRMFAAQQLEFLLDSFRKGQRNQSAKRRAREKQKP